MKKILKAGEIITPIGFPPMRLMNDIEVSEPKKRFAYGMRFRGFSLGCQPTEGLIETIDDRKGRYYDILIYDRQLTMQEIEQYELDELEEVRL